MVSLVTSTVKAARHLAFLKKPAAMAKVARGYWRTAVLRRPTLRSIELAVTYACQAKCAMCYAADLCDPPRRRLSLDEIRGIIDQAVPLGLLHVNLTGGEPTLRKDLPAIVQACRPNQIVVSLVTNALALTKEKLRTLREAGLNTVQISLDSADRDTHDRSRGIPGCYDKVLEAAAWARSLGLNLCFSTVLSTRPDGDKHAMQPLLDLAEKERAFLLVCDSAAIGGWKDQREVMLNCEERNEALAELMRHPQARHHNMYNFRVKAGCPAGTEKIYITAYGDVTPCDLIHDTAGNVRTEGLETIWTRTREHPLYAQQSTDCVRYLAEFPTRRPF